MGKEIIKKYLLWTAALWVLIIIGGCTSSKTKYSREYNRIWREMIKSQAWKNSLRIDEKSILPEDAELYSSTEEVVLIKEDYTANLDMDEVFKKKYHSLVSRAYFKIIAEAENADSRLKAEYEYWNAERDMEGINSRKTFKKKQALANKKYHAHREMLEGLKSWNIF